MWWLGTEPGSHTKAASTLNSQACVSTIYFMIPFLTRSDTLWHLLTTLVLQNTGKLIHDGVCVDGTLDKGPAM